MIALDCGRYCKETQIALQYRQVFSELSSEPVEPMGHIEMESAAPLS